MVGFGARVGVGMEGEGEGERFGGKVGGANV